MKGIFQTYIEWIKGNRTVVYGLQCVVTLGLLICMSIQDIRKKQISLWLLMTMAGFSVVMAIIGGWLENEIKKQIFVRALLGILPGGIMVLFGKLSGGALGEGDGYTTVTLGIQLGIFSVIECLLQGMVLSGIYSGILLLTGKGNRKDTIPFLPFLTAGYAIFLVVTAIDRI